MSSSVHEECTECAHQELPTAVTGERLQGRNEEGTLNGHAFIPLINSAEPPFFFSLFFFVLWFLGSIVYGIARTFSFLCRYDPNRPRVVTGDHLDTSKITYSFHDTFVRLSLAKMPISDSQNSKRRLACWPSSGPALTTSQ